MQRCKLDLSLYVDYQLFTSSFKEIYGLANVELNIYNRCAKFVKTVDSKH